MKNIFYRCISTVTLLLCSINTQYAAYANKTAKIKSIINNLNHNITIQFPLLSQHLLSIAPGDVFDTSNIPPTVFAPTKGIIQNGGSFYAEADPAITIITPQKQTFIVFIGILYQETVNSKPECGIWIFKISKAASAWTDYGGFACIIERAERITNTIACDSLIIDANWRKIPPYKNKPEFAEELSITRYDPVYNRNRSSTSPVTPPPAVISRPQSTPF